MRKKQAVALEYEQEQKKGAPRIVAVGEGHIAEKIVSLAREHGIPVVEDMELIGKLNRFPVGVEIPEELYESVAKILVFIYRLDRQKGHS